MSEATNFNDLRAQVEGSILLPGDTDYQQKRQIWNARLEAMPVAILLCSSAEDAAKGVRFANANNLKIAVKGGGHSYAGLSSGGDCLLIDFEEMTDITIDPGNKRATVEPGATWGPFNEAALVHGLLPVGGTVGSVGVSGLTLGGGTGWLTRQHGLALDNLISVEVVTAEGEILEASESANPDLFWGIRGSAGNLGIVTRFEFKLHPIPAQIFAGQIIYPFALAREGMQLYRSIMENAPASFCCFPALLRIPPIDAFPEKWHGEVVIDFILAHMGDIQEGEAMVQPLRELGDPIMDICAPQSFTELLKVFDAGTPPGQRWYSRSHYLKSLDDDTIDAFLEQGADLQGGFTFAYLEYGSGAHNRVAPDATAFPHRNMACGYHVLAGWNTSEEDLGVMEWVRKFHAGMEPFAERGIYVNLLAEDEPDRIRDAYGENYDRLRELKRKWDPLNRFQQNHNIQP